jgi:methylenetetrahydrofolate reductase (NADPH)
MPIFTPGRRWQPAFKPFSRQPVRNRILAGTEKLIKGSLWGCRMCGNCLLQETAYICAMECPKGLRNGPCGGSTPEHCYVDKSRPCIWYRIYERSFRMGRQERLLEVLPPLDWDKVGVETWIDVLKQVKVLGIKKTFRGLSNSNPEIRHIAWDNIFKPIRQPNWWEGDSDYHAPGYSEPVSEMEKSLRSGEFIVTAEIQPPLTVSTNALCKKIQLIKPYVTAANFTDSPSATPRMSSIACSHLAIEHGVEPVLQVAARDKTRVGLQADVVGASALGIRNVLCLSGDCMNLGPAPHGRMDILDIDSIQMLWILRRMRDEGRYLDGREMKFPPHYFLGAAASPFASTPQFQAIRDHKKVNAGAQFFQTNLVFDVNRLEIWLNELARRDILNKVFILVGVTPIKSFKMALYLERVPGVAIPEKIMKRMEDAETKGNSQEEGILIALETVENIRRNTVVNGIHIMAVGWEEIVPRIVVDAGLEKQHKSHKVYN